MNEFNSGYKLSETLTCPYCQSNIKQESEIIYCNFCGTPHHKECWDENTGCTSYGCRNNPVTGKRPVLSGVEVGNRTVGEIEKILEVDKKTDSAEDIICSKCEKSIDKNSVYCKFCGVRLKDSENKIQTSKLDTEYQQNFKDNYRLKKRNTYLTLSSVVILAILLITVLFFSYKIIDNRINSDEFKIKNLITAWNSSFKNKDPDKMKSLYEKDFVYYGKSSKEYNLDDRLKQFSNFIKNEKYKKSLVTELQFKFDSTSANYAFVTFKQNFYYDKEIKTENRYFKLYKNVGQENIWKIFREYYEL